MLAPAGIEAPAHLTVLRVQDMEASVAAVLAPGVQDASADQIHADHSDRDRDLGGGPFLQAPVAPPAMAPMVAPSVGLEFKVSNHLLMGRKNA